MSDLTLNVYSEHFIDLSIYQSGIEHCDAGHSFGPARREHYLFHYALSGSGTLYAETSSGSTATHEISAGEGFLIYPQQLATYVADADDPWAYTWIEFDGLRVKECLEQTSLSESHPVFRPLAEDQAAQMVREMTYIAEHPEASIIDIIGHLYLFFDHFVRSAQLDAAPRTRKMRDYYVNAAVGYIEKNYHRKITIEEIAAICGIDRSYFGKIFHDAVGHSPQEFLMRYRMIKASELLKHTDMSITDIASAVSYENPLHFSRAFKKVQGVSPRSWRNQHRVD
ncbi:MAG: AraC family transcriptional regulator [Clostridia bacterium]|nr:AraC family transcriptional regulator [Clostridia bacterium]